MGLFGKKKVRYGKQGVFTTADCPCGRSGIGLDYVAPLPDESVSGFLQDDLRKRVHCGVIFLAPDHKNQVRLLVKAVPEGNDRLIF